MEQCLIGAPDSDSGGFMDVEQEDILLLPPPLFSVKDMPEELV